VIECFEEVGALPRLSESPSLLKEELDNLEGDNEYDSCYEELEEEILRTSSLMKRRERILELISNKESILFGIIQKVKPLQEKAKQRREQKRQLLKELNE